MGRYDGLDTDRYSTHDAMFAEWSTNPQKGHATWVMLHHVLIGAPAETCYIQVGDVTDTTVRLILHSAVAPIPKTLEVSRETYRVAVVIGHPDFSAQAARANRLFPGHWSPTPAVWDMANTQWVTPYALLDSAEHDVCFDTEDRNWYIQGQNAVIIVPDNGGRYGATMTTLRDLYLESAMIAGPQGRPFVYRGNLADVGDLLSGGLLVRRRLDLLVGGCCGMPLLPHVDLPRPVPGPIVAWDATSQSEA